MLKIFALFAGYLAVMMAGSALFFVIMLGPIFYAVGGASGGSGPMPDFINWELNFAAIGACFGFVAAFTVKNY